LTESIDIGELEGAAEEYEAMANFMGVIGGLGIILFSQLAFFLASSIAYWIAVSAISDYALYTTFMEVFGLPIMILLICGIIAAGLMTTFWFLPVSSEYMNLSLMRATGLTLISLPLLPIGGYVLSGGIPGYFVGYDLSYWFIFPLRVVERTIQHPSRS
jgi:hypothetical protein